jgi:glycerol-3-phosphate acyltransferase PlsY
MTFWITSFGLMAAAYLLGATPTGYWAGRVLKDVDIRELGSKSTGATNALRTLGVGPGLIVLAVDILKGVAAVMLARLLYHGLSDSPTATPLMLHALQAWAPWGICLAGLAALLGHARSIWLGFTGGKSAATGLGVLLAMSWPVGLGAAATFILVVAAFRVVSLGSILAALTAIALACGLEHPLAYRLLVIAGGVYVIARHQANIQRLLAGTEPRLGDDTAEVSTAGRIEKLDRRAVKTRDPAAY